MMILLPLLGVWACFMVVLWAKRGDGRRDLRRCPRCWYSMDGQAGLKCPECGYAARIESELFQPRSHRGVFRAGLVVMVMTAAAWMWMVIPGAWTNKVPRFALRIALNMAEPYRGVPRTRTEIDQSVPNRQWMTSEVAWSRVLWQQQVNNVMRQWADAVMEKSGPITAEELPHLVELANLANESYVQTGGLAHGEGWISDVVKMDVARVRANSSDPWVKLRAEWVLSDLQYVGGDYSHRMDWGVIPEEVLQMSLAHSDTNVRLYGVDRVGVAARLKLMTPRKTQFPQVGDLVRQMAASDPDLGVRRRAKDVVSYMEAFNIK
ncbi:MAG: hypothetical protein KGS45_05945 [Planctomycetes bacterium]|nr:hypothetical protein [Planctomycetota bacterium]